ISLGFFFRTFAHPMVGLATLAIVLVTYFGRVGLRGGLPGGLVAVAVGTALAWLTGIAPAVAPALPAALHLPLPALGGLVARARADYRLAPSSLILPLGAVSVVR